MPTNLYGPMDKFDDHNGHVPAALLNRFHLAKINNLPKVIVWGSGTPLREFLYVDDLASAAIFLIKNLDAEELYKMGISHINIGSGEEISIKELATLIKDVVGFDGKLVFNKNMPDGMPRKLLDNTIINNLGWKNKTSLKDGIKSVYNWFLGQNY